MLLDAAEALFAERGYAAVSVRDIADHAGANIAAVSYHFGSKAELYLQTVCRAMQRRESAPAWELLEQPAEDRAEATGLLVRFIREFTSRVITGGQSPACRLIMHEAAGPSGAIDSVVNDYLRPHESRLIEVIGVLTAASFSEKEILLTAHSVLGQILHYVMLRPVIERLRVGTIGSETTVDEIASHVARFTLAALGCTHQEIVDAFAYAQRHEEVASS